MRVLFLTLYPDQAASPRYRVHQFIPYLESRGIECTVRVPMNNAAWSRLTGPNRRGRAFWYHARETPTRLMQILSAGRYDVVFVQKALMTAYLRGMDRILRNRARKLVYDIDDAVHLSPPHPLRGLWKRWEDPEQGYKMMWNADLVLTGNAWLEEEATNAGTLSECFPTVVDTDRFVPPPAAPAHFQVGWMGSPSTASSLHLIGDALASLQPDELTVAGADRKQLHSIKAQVVPWRYDTEVPLIQQFSVGVMPLPRDDWSRGKCALKALQYMACGVPCIATPHGAVLDIIRHGENGWFAESDADWREAFRALRNPQLRRRLGESARTTVEEQFSLRKAAPRLADLLEAL